MCDPKCLHDLKLIFLGLKVRSNNCFHTDYENNEAH